MTRGNKIKLTIGIATVLGFVSALRDKPVTMLGHMALYAFIAYAVATLIWRKPKPGKAVSDKKAD